MAITCPYCQVEQHEEKPAGDLMRCRGCQKVFEVESVPLKRRDSSSPKPQERSRGSLIGVEPIRQKRAMDLEATEFPTELGIVNLVMFFAYFVFACSVVVLLISLFTGGNFSAALMIAAIIFVSGVSLLLAAVVAKATMKTADYLRIIAQHLDS